MLRLTALERGRIERVKDLAPNAPREHFGTPGRLRLPAVMFDRLWNTEGAREDRGENLLQLFRGNAYHWLWLSAHGFPSFLFQ